MGLDMYLKKKIFLGWNYEHRTKDLTLPDLSKFGITANKISEVNEDAGYWRKANAIHKWFVDNVQDGNDDCSLESEVTKEKFEALFVAVMSELSIRDGNAELGNPGDFLPCQPGFFFGSYEYNEWYYESLEYTRDLVDDILKNWPDTFDINYYYQSSW